MNPEGLVAGVMDAFSAVQLEAANARDGFTFALVALSLNNKIRIQNRPSY